MKKQIFSLLLMFFISSLVFSQTKNPDLEKTITNKDSANFYFFKYRTQIRDEKQWILYYKFKTEFCLLHNKTDSVLFYGNEALKKISKLVVMENTESNFRIYYNIAQSYRINGESENAIKTVLKGLRIAEKHTNVEWLINYNTFLSLCYHDFKRFQKGVFYGRKALKYCEEFKRLNYQDAKFAIDAIAINYDDNGKSDSAIYFHKKNISLAKNKDTLELFASYCNVGNTLLKQKKFIEAQFSLNKSKRIIDFQYSKKSKDIYYYYGKATVDLNLAIIATELNKFKEANDLFNAVYYNAKKSAVPDILKEYYISKTVFYKKNKKFKEALALQERYLFFMDSLDSSEKSIKFEELETKYQTAKKEQLIQKQKADAKQQNLYFVIVSSLGLLAILFGYLFYKNQKTKNNQQKQESALKEALLKIEAENQLQEQRLGISKELHDNIGSQLTFVISAIDTLKQNYPNTNEKIDNQLENINSFTKNTITELRDTVWVMNTKNIDANALKERLLENIERAKLSHINIDFKVNIDNFEIENSSVALNLFRTIQEAMNNALKYAKATEIEITIQGNNNQIEAFVTDNGLGFDVASKLAMSGNGLRNMKKRIQTAKGTFAIESQENLGTKISVVIPKNI